MKIKVVIAPDGAVQVIAQEGDFSSASTSVLALLRSVGAAGVKLSDQSEPEQHRHEPGVEVHGHNNQ